MKSIEVCLSPELINNYELEGKISVVVDVLRATSCMASGLATGVNHIMPFQDPTECQQMKNKGYVAAGERNGDKIPGMDMGNSPFEYMAEEMKGKNVATTTTNGTKCIHLSKGAKHIITGSFLNLSAVEKFIRTKDLPVLIFCAGWKGKTNLEDTLFAGALISKLQSDFLLADDSSKIALSAYVQAKDNLFENISQSEHAKRLAKFNITKDIAFCSRTDEFDIVPIMEGEVLIPAVF